MTFDPMMIPRSFQSQPFPLSPPAARVAGKAVAAFMSAGSVRVGTGMLTRTVIVGSASGCFRSDT